MGVTLTLIQIDWKKKTFFKKLEYRFLVETTKTGNTSIPFKTALSKPLLRQIEQRLQNRPITKGEVLPVETSFLWHFVGVLEPLKKN